MTDAVIRQREEISEQIRALRAMKEMAEKAAEILRMPQEPRHRPWRPLPTLRADSIAQQVYHPALKWRVEEIPTGESPFLQAACLADGQSFHWARQHGSPTVERLAYRPLTRICLAVDSCTGKDR